MAVDWTTLDYSNPAALLAVLRPAYFRLVAGDAEAEIEGHDRRRVKFHAGDKEALQRVIADLEAQQGGTRRRYALVGAVARQPRGYY